jgi:amidohydrolase
VAFLNPEAKGKTILLRADMDALPIEEKSGVDFASEKTGMMHACGHDAHTAMLLTVARVLSRVKEQLPVRVMLLFQPSEECEQSGARCMVEHGVTEGVNYAVTIHCGNEHPTGYLGVVAGDYLAACDPITLTFHGKTAHATRAAEGVDAIQMAMQAWEGLKKIEAEEVGSRKHIFSLGYFHGGTAHNVISDTCAIKISFRYYDTAFAARVRARGIALLEEICARFGGTVDIDWNTSAPPVINDGELAQRYLASAKKIAGKNCGATGVRMGSEDFAWYLTKVPGIATRLGTGNPEKGSITTGHTNSYRIDEDAFENGVLGLCQFILDAEES